jgi:hypothetical protein
MADVHHSTYSRTCPACAIGRAWFYRNGRPIRLCAEHQRIVRHVDGWTEVKIWEYHYAHLEEDE